MKKAYSARNSEQVNQHVQKKFKDLIKQYPDGLWCSELPEKYHEIYKSELNFRDFGYTSLIQMVLELPETFRCYQASLSDWLLFDASAPLSDQEKETEMNLIKEARDHIPASIKLELNKLLKPYSDIGVNMKEIPPLYYKKYGRRLGYEYYGFEDIKSFFQSLEGDILHLRKAERHIYVIPLQEKITKAFQNEEVENFNSLGDAIPPILPGDDLFPELFPENVYGPNESIPPLLIENYLEPGSRIEIVVADVWTPHRFYVQLKQYELSLKELTNDLENFFNEKLDRYKMPEVTVQPKQICAVYFNSQNVVEKWHRAEIIKILKNGKASVRLIDFGSTVCVKNCQLRFLARKFGDLPRLAIPASLSNLEPVDLEKTWPDSTNERFLELVAAASMWMEVVDINYEEPRVIIKLWDVTNKTKSNINKNLIKQGLACFSEEVYNFCRREKRKAKEQEPKKCEESKKMNEEIIPPPIETSSKHKTTNKNKKKQSQDSEVKEINAKVIPPDEKIPTASSINIDPLAAEAPAAQNPKTPNDPVTNINSPISEQNKPVTKIEPEFQIPSPSIPDSFGNEALMQYLQLLQAQIQVQTYQQQLIQQMQIEKRQINQLAVHFFSNNAEIKNMAQFNPELALKLATNLAEEYYKNMKSVVNLQNAAAIATATAAAVASTTNFNATTNISFASPAEQTEINDLSKQTLQLNINESSSKIKFEIKEIEVEDYKVHIVTIEKKAFVCIDQIIQHFTSFSTRANLDKILSSKKQKFEYKMLSRLENEFLFDELERYNSFRLGENDEEDMLALLPLKEVSSFLTTVRSRKESTKMAFNLLAKNFN